MTITIKETKGQADDRTYPKQLDIKTKIELTNRPLSIKTNKLSSS
jgi:hypothetical protein